MPITSALMPITSTLMPITSTLMPITSTLMPITSTLMSITSTLMPITSTTIRGSCPRRAAWRRRGANERTTEKAARDWPALRVHPLSPRAIGPRSEYIPSLLARLARAP
eukprot:6835021-Pyramimonas_sp.AAC.1